VSFDLQSAHLLYNDATWPVGYELHDLVFYKKISKLSKLSVFISRVLRLSLYHSICMVLSCCSFGQGSSLLWTHTLRPFVTSLLR